MEGKKTFSTEYLKGVLVGLKVCKELWAQGQLNHEAIYEHEVYYGELLKETESSDLEVEYETVKGTRKKD